MKSYPTTTVDLHVEGMTSRIRMAINPDLVHNAIMGVDVPNLGNLVPHTQLEKKQPERSRNIRVKRKCRKQINYAEQPSTSTSEEEDGPELMTMETEENDTSISPDSSEESSTPSQESELPSTTEDESTAEDKGGEDESMSTTTTTEDEQDDLHLHSTYGLPDLSDDIFLKTSIRNRLSKQKKREDSRRYAAIWGQPTPLDGGSAQLRAAQEEDPSLKTLRRQADLPQSPFFRKDDLLYRRWIPPKQKEIVEQLVLPRQYREKTLRMAHISPWAGHLGRKRTTERILHRFFWPGLKAEVADLCRRCQTCQKTVQGQTRKAPLVTLPVIAKPLSRVAMDMVGPLPTTEEGHKYILTVCDYGTRFPEAFPLKATTSRDVADALVDFFARVGFPEEILTDRGSNFCGELTTEFLKMFGIRHIKTSAYHPETDSMVERYNATLKSGLRKYVDRFGGQWDKAIPYLLFAYRELPHESTGFSPFELVYGRNPRGPLDVLREEWQEPAAKKESMVSFMLDTYEKLKAARDLAKATETKAKTNMKTWYDKTARARSFEVDDLVLVLLPSHSNKLLAKWQGPFLITEKLSTTTYRVRMEHIRRPDRTYHVNMLSRWESPSAVCLFGTIHDQTQPEEEDIPTWSETPSSTGVTINKELPSEQRQDMERLLTAHQDVFKDQPGRTETTSITIDTGDSKPISSPPYRLPQARL